MVSHTQPYKHIPNDMENKVGVYEYLCEFLFNLYKKNLSSIVVWGKISMNLLFFERKPTKAETWNL